ncbi:MULTISPECIES: DinB family protein [unclassified Brevibacterium]|uniref:DinB family protein n=1 Tax=unclassified Brevibacterium TaxID=2614124 RepID=UPI0010918FC3|nr:DinB family protein [Brevibacterium sp. S22]TGD33361.1 DinB family protein [Brevibacterium sp. S22]
MSDDETMKSLLRASLHRGRDNLRWKLSGLDEKSLRWPRTPTGFNLLGALKHMAQVEIVYFGDTFGRSWPHPEEVVTDADIDLDPQADWCAPETETTEYLLDLYARVADFADETIETRGLDAPGRVPHWPEGHDETTLGQSMVHVLVDLTRHLGQIDIVREGIDGAAGLSEAAPNLPPTADREAYLARLRGIADRF